MLKHSPERSLPDNFFRSSAPGPLPGKSRRVGFAEVTGVRPDASSASTPRHTGGAAPALPSQNESEGRGRAETPFTVAQVLLARNKSAREQEGSLPIPTPGPSFSAARSYPSPGLSPSSGTPPTHRMPASTAPEPRSLCVCVCVCGSPSLRLSPRHTHKRISQFPKVAVRQWLFPPTHYTLNHNPKP
jgi:hypothetical protein